MKRFTYVLAAGALATGLLAATQASATADPISAAQLQSLIPAPANAQQTFGPDDIGDNGIHLRYRVNGMPGDVMNGFKAALQGKGWDMTTIITGNGGGGGGATYTGTNAGAYGVFDGGGYENSTWIDVCAWPSQPAEPNCSRGGR